MDYTNLHQWNLSQEEAKKVQCQLAGQVKQPKGFIDNINYIAGCDISFNPGSNIFYAGIVVISLPERNIIEKVAIKTTETFPYIPGLLSFRESPALLKAWKMLQTKPDLVIIDGHGISHPRGLGIASHFGLLIDIPTIGCAKSLLCGKHGFIADKLGSKSDIVFGNKTVGRVIRTREGEQPIYISVGHDISLEQAVGIVTNLCSGCRLPLTTRLAHDLVNQARKGLVNAETKE